MDKEKADMIIYTTEDGLTKVETTFDGETVWLSIDQMAELFQRDRSVIGKHVRNIFKEGELEKESVWAKFAYTATDGKVYNVDYYNLDVIISVGYRVKSKRGTQFRIWATGEYKKYKARTLSTVEEDYLNAIKILEKKQIKLYELIGISDGLLSDYSSVAVDYLLLDRPLGYVLADYNIYKEKRGFVFKDPLEYMPGEKIYNACDIRKFMKHLTDGTDSYRQERAKNLKQMHNKTENYCKRLADYLQL